MLRFSRNVLFLFGSSIGNSLLAFLFAAYATRRLNTGEFGKFSTVQIFVTSLTVLTEVGLTQVAIREVAQKKEQTFYIAGNLLTLKALLGLVGFIFAISLAFILRYDTQTQILIFIYSLSLIFLSISNAAVAIFSGHERMAFSTAINWGTALGNALSILVLLLGYGLPAIFISLVASTFLTTILCIGFLRRHFSVSSLIMADLSLWKRYLITGLPFGLMAIMGSAGVSIGPIMLSRLVGEIEVGYFNAAFKIVNILNLIIAAYNLAVYPVFSRLYSSSQEKLQFSYELSMKIMLVVGLPVAIGMTVIADKLILLTFPKYILATPALQILVWFWFFSLLATPVLNLLYAEKRENEAVIVTLIAVILCLISNFILIPFIGLVGVCVGFVLLTVVQFFAAYVRISQKYQTDSLAIVIAKTSLISLLIAALGIFFHSWNLYFLMFAMLGVWGVSFMILQLFDNEEWNIIAELPMMNKLRQVVMHAR
ncbi:MAG: flippase [Caldilineaceae bacterium]